MPAQRPMQFVIGKFYIEDNKYCVEYDPKFGDADQGIYIHVIDDKIIRVGSSKNKLKSRMKSWERDVSKALAGQKSSTPIWEANIWKKILKNKSGDLYFRYAATKIDQDLQDRTRWRIERAH